MAVNGIEIKYGQKWLSSEGTRLRVKELGQDYAVLEELNGRCGYFDMNGVSKKNPSVRLLRLAERVAVSPKFKEGQVWRSRNGQCGKVLTTEHNGFTDRAKFPILVSMSDGATRGYTAVGTYNTDGTPGNPLDLVELIEDVQPAEDLAPAPVPQAVELVENSKFPGIPEEDRAVGKTEQRDLYAEIAKDVAIGHIVGNARAFLAPYGAPDLLDAAASHMRDRAATYDKPEGERSIAQVVTAFNAIHGTAMTEVQGWHFMCLLKQVRAFSAPGKAHRDSLEDNIAYSALMGEAMLKGGAQ